MQSQQKTDVSTDNKFGRSNISDGDATQIENQVFKDKLELFFLNEDLSATSSKYMNKPIKLHKRFLRKISSKDLKHSIEGKGKRTNFSLDVELQIFLNLLPPSNGFLKLCCEKNKHLVVKFDV